MSTELNPSQVNPVPQAIDLTPPGVSPSIEQPTVPSVPVRISRAERKAATRKRILAAAREVFFRDGFMDTSLDEVASRASIGKGTLYRHFESKAELYVAVLMENGTYFEKKMLDAYNPDADAIEQIRSVGEFYCDFWTHHPNHFAIFWAINNQSTIGDLPAPLLVQVKELWERPLRHLEAIVEKGVAAGTLCACDPWVMANVIWNIGNSGFSAMITPEKSRVVDCSPDEMYRAGLELVLRGLEKS
jgi:TetR/AcrR family transcriptional regulator